MNSNASILLGFAGAAVGLFIPEIMKKIALYKGRQKKLDFSPDKLRTSALLRVLLCVQNMAVWALAGLLMETFLASVFVSVLFTTVIIIAIIDLRVSIIPNELVLVLILVGVAFQVTYYGFVALLVSVVCMITLMVLFTAAAGFVGSGRVGAGDVKLAGAMGLTLGYPNITTALVILCAALFIYSFAGLITKKLTLKSTFPFAPFMAAGMGTALICMVFGIEPFFATTLQMVSIHF